MTSLIFSKTAIANPVYLKKSEPTPFAGFLFTQEETKGIYMELLHKDALVQQNASFERSLKAYKEIDKTQQEKIAVLTEQNIKMVEVANSNKSLTDLQKVMYVGIGIAVTVLAGFAISNAK